MLRCGVKALDHLACAESVAGAKKKEVRVKRFVSMTCLLSVGLILPVASVERTESSSSLLKKRKIGLAISPVSLDLLD